MATSLREFISELDKARRELNKVPSPQLQSQSTRRELQAIVERYFADIRPSIAAPEAQDEATTELDTLFQELLILSHKRALVTKYKSQLKAINNRLIGVDSRVVTRPSNDTKPTNADPINSQIVTILTSLVPSAALSYQQALADLSTDNRSSWRGPATDLREALRETLDHLAPDDDVTSMTGYKPVPNTNGPTMKQKVRFILRSRGKSKAMSETTENATSAVDDAVGTFVRSVYNRSSVSTHTPTEKAEVLRVRDLVRVVLCELLEIRT